MKYILNKLQEKTTNNFRVNEIKLDLDLPENFKLKKYEIKNNKLEITEEEKTETLTSKIGLTLNKYKELNIKVPKYFNAKEPIIIRYTFEENNDLAENINIEYESSSSANIIFIYNSKDDTKSFHFFKENLIMQENSNATISIINLMNSNSESFISVESNVKENASVTHNIIDLGGKIRLSNVYSELKEYNASNKINSIYLGSSEDIIDINYYLKNISKKTSSIIRTEGCLLDSSKKTFRGTIDFVKGAEKSIGDEQENCVIMSDKAKSKSLPVLLCGEEDVEGAHGVSSGKVDESKLFYLMSRGFSEKQAKRLIISANLTKIINNIPDELIKEEINEYLDKKIGE